MNNTDSVNTTVEADTWQLNALTEALGDLTLTVTESLSIGRGSDNDVVLGSKQVSRNHAVLSTLDGQLYVKDLDSSNGTFINEERIEGNKSHLLQVHDTLSFATFSFQVIAPVDETKDEALMPGITDATTANVNAETETVAAEPTFETPIVEEPIIKEPVVKKTKIEEILPTKEQPAPTSTEAAATPSETPVVERETIPVTKEAAPTVIANNEPVVEQPAVREEPPVRKEPVVEPEHDKTTTTDLQEEADPDVLRAKQAATAQFSGTANLGQSRDLGTEGNNAMDQAIDNPATTSGTEKKPSGSWFIWVFVALIIIGVALWLFNVGGV